MKKKTMKILRTRNQTKSCLPSAAAPAAAPAAAATTNNIEISIGSNSLPHDLFSTLTSAFKDFLCSFAEKNNRC